MSPRTVLATALGAASLAAARITSPLFILSSTALLDLPVLPANPQISDIHQTLWGAFSTCPTKHYAVVEQPGVTHADFSHVYLPVTSNARTTISTQNITGGHGDTIAIINTILMDCLNKGVGTVEPLDASKAGAESFDLPGLTQEQIDDRIMWIPLPDLTAAGGDRAGILGRHFGYVQTVIEEYFGGEDYTLVYVTKEKEYPEKDQAAHEEQQKEEEAPAMEHIAEEDEVPFVFGGSKQ